MNLNANFFRKSMISNAKILLKSMILNEMDFVKNMTLIEKFFVLSDFGSNYFRLVRFRIKIFTTCQISNQLFYKASDFEQELFT